MTLGITNKLRGLWLDSADLAAPEAVPISALRRPYGCARLGSAIQADHRMSLNNGGYAMRTFDLAPLYRSTVGFDRLFSMLDGFESAPGYPPYNIERSGE